jgi:hypothetical protein
MIVRPRGSLWRCSSDRDGDAGMANVELALARDGEVGGRSSKVRVVLGIGSLARRPSLEIGVWSVESDGDGDGLGIRFKA